MKSFKDMLEEEGMITEAAEYGQVYDKRKFNPNNPEVQVIGVGLYKLEGLKQNILRKLEDLVSMAKADNYDNLLASISPKGILNHFVNAVVEVERELQSPVMKRRVTMMNRVKESRLQEKKKFIKEDAPRDPKIEAWIKANKEAFIKKYGKEKGLKLLYMTAWKMYNEKHGKK